MATVNEVLGNLLQNAIDNPKSTVQALLSAVYAATLFLMGVGSLSPKVAGIVVSLNTVAKIGLGMAQHDTAKVPAAPAANPAQLQLPLQAGEKL